MIIGVIPSRYGSTRFEGKSLYPILGKPLVAWVVEAVKRSALLERVIVATDDERIAAVAREAGAEAVMTDSDLPSGTDRVSVAANAADDDIVLNIQGDEPLIDPALIDGLARRMLEDKSVEMATAATVISSRAEYEDNAVVKVVLDGNSRALYFSRWAIPYRRDGEANLESGLWRRHIGIYAYRGAFLKQFVKTPPCALEQTEKLEQLRALWLGARIAVVETANCGVGVDKPEDVAIVEEALRRR